MRARKQIFLELCGTSRRWHEPCARRGAVVRGGLAVVILTAAPLGCERPPAADDAARPPPAPSDSVAAPGWFTDVTAEYGLSFVHETGARGECHMPEIMGGGCALFDADHDGDLDACLVNGAFDLGRASAHGGPRNRFFRLDGARYVDATDPSGLGDPGYGMGVAIGDIDNDGFVDVYFTNYGPDRLYRNRGDGTFEDVTARAGIHVPGWSASAAFFDYDRDGFLDLFVTQYLDYDESVRCTSPEGEPYYCAPQRFRPVPDVLLHNDGDGTFTDVSAAAGIAALRAAGLGVIALDLTDDGWCDLYVANDGYPAHLWVNQQNGTFREVAVVLGCAVNLHGQAEAGMGVFAADIENDGDFDLFKTHQIRESNTMYENLGPPAGLGFQDITGSCGLGASSLPYTGFGTIAFDAEHDGDVDIAIVNGRVARFDPVEGVTFGPPWNVYAEHNQFYLNDGQGVFSPAQAAGRDFTKPIEISRGLACGDIDGDGDLDLLVSNTHGPARLYRNEAPRTGAGHWLLVRAFDPRLNRDALGALVAVEAQGRRQVRPVLAASSYLSSLDPRAHFGLGDVTHVDRVTVLWPDGLRESFNVPGVDRVVELSRGGGEAMD
jgi:hypothetical protein